jgi:hypothetical protein
MLQHYLVEREECEFYNLFSDPLLVLRPLFLNDETNPACIVHAEPPC